MSAAVILWGCCAIPIAWMAYRLLRPKGPEEFGQRGSLMGGYKDAVRRHRDKKSDG